MLFSERKLALWSDESKGLVLEVLDSLNGRNWTVNGEEIRFSPTDRVSRDAKKKTQT